MSAPPYTTIFLELLQIDGNDCDPTPGAVLSYIPDSDPPEFQSDGSSNPWARCWQTDLGYGEYTWDLMVFYNAMESPCSGGWRFTKIDPEAEGPTGDYGIGAYGEPDPSEGLARVTIEV